MPLSGPWTLATDCSLRSCDSASLRRQLSASEAGAPPLTKSWIRTCPHIRYNFHFRWSWSEPCTDTVVLHTEPGGRSTRKQCHPHVLFCRKVSNLWIIQGLHLFLSMYITVKMIHHCKPISEELS